MSKKYILITGSSGLIGSEAAEFFFKKGFYILGIDNNFRKKFFGNKGSILRRKKELELISEYEHFDYDIRNTSKIEKIFKKYKDKIKCVIHCAAQPSHDWAKTDPLIDFDINSRSTLNLLLLFKKFCPDGSFINLSTNKVYGDNPNKLDIEEKETRFELSKKSKYFPKGIDETMSTDNCIHSFFGSSKLSADLYVQEFGKNLNLNTVTFRGGCLTGENHSGVELHGFLSYFITNLKNSKPYTIFGYKGKQVRDNIHSSDLIKCFWEYFKKPIAGEIFNIGGGRKNSCSILEVIELMKNTYKSKSKITYIKKNRTGDHIWWITDNSKFSKFYPNWEIKQNLHKIIKKIVEK